MVPEQTIKYAMLMADPEFQRLLKGLAASPALKPLYATEAALTVGLFFFRIWMGPRHKTLWGRGFFQLWTLVVYLLLGSYFIPRFWMGPDLDAFLGKLIPILPPWLLPWWPWG
jgi:hypothetical protein